MADGSEDVWKKLRRVRSARGGSAQGGPTSLLDAAAAGVHTIMQYKVHRSTGPDPTETMFVSTRPCRLCNRAKGLSMQGTVKWFDHSKKFGFIQPTDGSPDVFVHHSAVEGDSVARLIDGAKVEFETTQGTKGPQANNVRVID